MAKQIKLRSTKQKSSIKDELLKAQRPLSPLELYNLSKSKIKNLSIATVYRNLRSLLEQNQIKIVQIPGEADRYETLEAALHHHHHFKCDSCKKVYDIEAIEEDCIQSMSQDKIPRGFIVKRHETTLYGTCGECN